MVAKLALVLILAAWASAQTGPRKNHQQRWYDECGTSKYENAGRWNPISSYIVNGQTARENEFPWSVSLRRRPGGSSSHSCGGVLIHPRWVLTAAHCVYKEPASTWDIVVGEHDMNQQIASRRVHEVETYIVQKDYGKLQWFDSDVALVRLKEPVEFNENVVPACAPNPGRTYEGQKAAIAGWGSVTSDYWNPSPVLLYINTTISSNEECKTVHDPAGITDNMMCAGDFPDFIHDSCNGDSGGPMTVRDESNGYFEVVGLVSWGTACAYWAPGVYVRLGNYVDWVDSILAQY